MDLAATLALFARGRDEWNAWAATTTERGRKIVTAGEWAWATDSRSEPYPANQVTQDYLHDAAAIFSYHEFAGPPDFGGFVFPGYAGFIAAKFRRGANFRGTKFGNGAGFNYARFDATADFDGAEFCSEGDFYNTAFFGETSFRDARFVSGEFEPSMKGQADFSSAKFAMPANFAGMRCDGNGIFGEAKFEQAVEFTGASFGKMFFIYRAVFRGPVLVQGTRFPDRVDWSEATLAAPPVE